MDLSGSSSRHRRRQRRRVRTLRLLAPLTVLLATSCAPQVVQQAEGCTVPANWSVPEQIGALWRCELAAAGVPAEVAARLAAEAVVLAHCESAWNPSAVAFAGQFRTVTHPVTGRTHTESGVFQLSSDDAELFVPGGGAAVLDARANIVGAARLFLSRYLGAGRLAGFSAWECAPKVIPGFATAPPELPEWAWSY